MPRSTPALVATLAVLLGIGALAAWSVGDDESAETAQTVPVVPVVPIETTTTTTTIPDDCELSVRFELGVVDPQVACLETRLAAAGVFDGEPDDVVY